MKKLITKKIKRKASVIDEVKICVELQDSLIKQ